MLTNPGRKMYACIPQQPHTFFAFMWMWRREMRAVCWSIFFLTDSHYSAFVLSRSPSPALRVNKTKTGVSHSTLAWFIAEKWKDANFRGGEGASAEKRRQKTHCTTARLMMMELFCCHQLLGERCGMRCDGCVFARGWKSNYIRQ
jgi:hypothetical protein